MWQRKRRDLDSGNEIVSFVGARTPMSPRVPIAFAAGGCEIGLLQERAWQGIWTALSAGEAC